MKVAFVGKGGSGKTSIASILARYIKSKDEYVLAVDSDLNQLLAFNIAPEDGIENDSIEFVGNNHKLVADYFRYKNERIDPNGTFNRTTPPGEGSRLIRLQNNDELLNRFTSKVDGIDFIHVGQPTQQQIGERCYHTNMSVNEILLNHIVDKDDEYILVDLTAGIDTIISGMFVSYDVIFTIIEPSLHSTKVFNDYKRIADETGYKANIVPVANKIVNQDDVTFIENNINEKIEIAFESSGYFRSIERGERKEFDKNTIDSLDRMFNRIKKTNKNWKKFYEGLLLFHEKRAMSMNDKIKKELLEQVDPHFDIEEEVSKMLSNENE
jgi:CO dehydrogenase maturation factor